MYRKKMLKMSVPKNYNFYLKANKYPNFWKESEKPLHSQTLLPCVINSLVPLRVNDLPRLGFELTDDRRWPNKSSLPIQQFKIFEFSFAPISLMVLIFVIFAEVFFLAACVKLPLSVNPPLTANLEFSELSTKCFRGWNICCPFGNHHSCVCDLNEEIPIVTLPRIYLILILMSLALTGLRVTLWEINSFDIFLQGMCSVSEHVRKHRGI